MAGAMAMTRGQVDEVGVPALTMSQVMMGSRQEVGVMTQHMVGVFHMYGHAGLWCGVRSRPDVTEGPSHPGL